MSRRGTRELKESQQRHRLERKVNLPPSKRHHPPLILSPRENSSHLKKQNAVLGIVNGAGTPPGRLGKDCPGGSGARLTRKRDSDHRR